MWKYISNIIDDMSLLVRIVFNDKTYSEWSSWLTFPTEGYGEVMRHGPFTLNSAEYIEIDPIEIKKLGTRVPDKKIDHSEALIRVLSLENIEFKIVDGVFLIKNK